MTSVLVITMGYEIYQKIWNFLNECGISPKEGITIFGVTVFEKNRRGGFEPRAGGISLTLLEYASRPYKPTGSRRLSQTT